MTTTERAIENDATLKKLLKGPKTRQQLGVTRYRLQKLMADKLVKRSGEAKNPKSGARKAVTYELMAKGRKRAERL
jgi:predicted MarR family transcription regulator